MGASRSFVLAFALVCLIALSPLGWWPVTAAQDNPLVSIDDIVQRYADLGSGCNEVALGLPMTTSAPLSPDQAWIDAHAACIGSDFRAAGGCYGLTDTHHQYELCIFGVQQGDGVTTIDCDAFALESFGGTYGVSRAHTDTLMTQFQQLIEKRHLTQLGTVQSCTKPGVLQAKMAMLSR